ncbi:hypothetical protein ACJX0J_006860, partial [Zea mays]
SHLIVTASYKIGTPFLAYHKLFRVTSVTYNIQGIGKGFPLEKGITCCRNLMWMRIKLTVDDRQQYVDEDKSDSDDSVDLVICYFGPYRGDVSPAERDELEELPQ